MFKSGILGETSPAQRLGDPGAFRCEGDMITLDVKADIAATLKRVQGIRTEVVDQASAAALNRTADKARTAMTREITREFEIPAAQVRNSLEVFRASKALGNLTATLRAFGSRKRNGRSLNLIHFLERKVTLAEAKRRKKGGTLNQLRFKVRKGQGAKVIPGAFLGNNGRTVFQRVGKERLPIKALATVDVPAMFNTRRINARVVEVIQGEFPIEFERAVRVFSDRLNARR